MKTKIFVAVLVSLLVISALPASKLIAAKPDDPGEGKKPEKAQRPEKLEQIIFVHPVAPDRPDSPGKGKKPPKEEPPKDNTYYELWGGYLDNILPAEYYINPNIGLGACPSIRFQNT